MTSKQIVEHLAREFSTTADHVRSTLEMIDAGLTAPFIGRVRRAGTGGATEGTVRRLSRRRAELEELDRRRGTILRMLGAAPEGEPSTRSEDKAEAAPEASPSEAAAPGAEGAQAVATPVATPVVPVEPTTPEPARPQVSEKALQAVRTCMDRFELEDLFLPHRRPEPEVQLALDRGLGALADLLVAPVPKSQRKASSEEASEEASSEEASSEEASSEEASSEEASSEAPAPDAPAEPEAASAQPAPTEAAEAAPEAAPPAGDEAPAEAEPSAEAPAEAAEAPAGAPEEGTAAPDAPAPADAEKAGEAKTQEVTAGKPAAKKGRKNKKQDLPDPDKPYTPEEEALLHGQIELTPALARICQPFVLPDRGVHTDAEALTGAVRILSDRIGRDAHLRGTIRRILQKRGVLTVRPTAGDGKVGRHRSLLKVRRPLRQVQGNQLLAIRQAQKERVLTTVIALDRKLVLPKVRAALGRHTDPEFASVLDAIALRTLEHRLLPLLEQDVRLELKERADEEALRFLSQHLRQVLLAPPLWRQPVAGIDVNAKGDWTVALIDPEGGVQGSPGRIEVGDKEPAALGEELKALLSDGGRVRAVALAVGHGKSSRAGLMPIRKAVAAAGLEVSVLLVNESGVSSYANSELGRKELSEHTVPQRMAITLGRRLQDPLAEIVKVDPRHLGLGSEQGLVSKANLRRVFDDTIESAVSHVGCDVNTAPTAILAKIPGLDDEAVAKIVARRQERPFASREELRSEGVLTEVQWTNAIGFLRVRGSPEPLDATSLHPEQYPIARRVIESAGGTVEDSLGKPGVTKGLRRSDDVDEATWRDLMRELWHPGRDPRPRLFLVRPLDPDTDRVTLMPGRVVDGVVSNVASFGAFVDLGLEQDGLIHVSEISGRYVRDARELVSVGQTVRAKIVDASSQRIALSVKDVPDPDRGPGRGAGRGAGGGRGRGGRRDERREPEVPMRAARSRRDGLAGSGGKERGRGRGGPGGGGRGPGRGGPGRGRPGRGRDREDSIRPEELESITGGAKAYNPFANFFKTSDAPPAETEKPPTPPLAGNEPSGEAGADSPAPAE